MRRVVHGRRQFHLRWSEAVRERQQVPLLGDITPALALAVPHCSEPELNKVGQIHSLNNLYAYIV